MKIVPPSAASNAPSRSTRAPVKAPFVCPNISDSISSRGTAAQSTTTYGRCERTLCSCSASATSSLPVPVSPSMMTEVSVCATLAIRSNSAYIDVDTAHIRPNCRGLATNPAVADRVFADDAVGRPLQVAPVGLRFGTLAPMRGLRGPAAVGIAALVIGLGGTWAAPTPPSPSARRTTVHVEGLSLDVFEHGVRTMIVRTASATYDWSKGTFEAEGPVRATYVPKGL